MTKETDPVSALLRERLRAEDDSLGYVNLAVGTHLYFPEDFIQSCIDELQRKGTMAAAGIEELTDVDRLAFHVLITAAGVEKEVEERFSEAKQSQTTTGEQK